MLVRRNGFPTPAVSSFAPLFQELDAVMREFAPSSAPGVAISAPEADVLETKDALLVMLDLPGHAPDQLQVKLEDQTLTIRSERTLASAPEEATVAAPGAQRRLLHPQLQAPAHRGWCPRGREVRARRADHHPPQARGDQAPRDRGEGAGIASLMGASPDRDLRSGGAPSLASPRAGGIFVSGLADRMNSTRVRSRSGGSR